MTAVGLQARLRLRGVGLPPRLGCAREQPRLGLLAPALMRDTGARVSRHHCS
jgi:hypothetical protein